MDLRIGHGVDIHPFASDRKLVLGNVVIPCEVGLEGHSDADVLLHAVIDAVLGATGNSDIGQLFPNSDPSLKDIDSSLMFSQVWSAAVDRGWQLVNADICVLAEMPKLAPHFMAIRNRVAELFGVDVSRIGLKATTAERMGFVGRKEGIFASAVLLLSRG